MSCSENFVVLTPNEIQIDFWFLISDKHFKVMVFYANIRIAAIGNIVYRRCFKTNLFWFLSRGKAFKVYVSFLDIPFPHLI